MKQEQFLYKSEGLYYMQNVPEYPVANRSGRMFSMFGYEYELAEYYEALERAKEEAHIQCPKDGELYRRVLIAHGMFQEYNMYTLNMEEKIEVVDIPCEGAACPSRWGQSCIHSKLIARIAEPKKQEESESQEEDGNLYAILITNTFTKVITLYPVCYKTIGEAEISINGIPRLKYANTFDVVEIKRKPLINGKQNYKIQSMGHTRK